MTVSTQGTLLISSDMQEYFLTALQGYDGIEGIVEYTTVQDTWEKIVPILYDKVVQYVYHCTTSTNGNTVMCGAHSTMWNMCFEAYCKDRRTYWGHTHTELAVGYDHSGLNLLGIMCDNVYVPHFHLPGTIFTQPVYVCVTHTKEVYAIMSDMDRVVLGEISYDMFMQRYFPERVGTRCPIHMEGWVLLTPIDRDTQTMTMRDRQTARDAHTDGQRDSLPHGHSEGLMPVTIRYDYSKIKTSLYYQCHKLHDKNIPQLLSLPLSAHRYYPLLRVLVEFHNDSERKLCNSLTMLTNCLTESLSRESMFYEEMNEKARKRVDLYLESVRNMSPESAEAIERDRDVVYKMFINVCRNSMNRVLNDVNSIVWCRNNNDELNMFMKGLLMRVSPWKKDSVKVVSVDEGDGDEKMRRP